MSGISSLSCGICVNLRGHLPSNLTTPSAPLAHWCGQALATRGHSRRASGRDVTWFGHVQPCVFTLFIIIIIITVLILGCMDQISKTIIPNSTSWNDHILSVQSDWCYITTLMIIIIIIIYWNIVSRLSLRFVMSYTNKYTDLWRHISQTYTAIFKFT